MQLRYVDRIFKAVVFALLLTLIPTSVKAEPLYIPSLTTIPVDAQPWGIAITPNGEFGYVANRAANSISVFKVSDYSSVSTIVVGNAPRAVAISPNGTRAYITNSGDGTLSIIELGTNSVVKTLVVGNNPCDVAFSPNGSRAYATNLNDNSISVIDVISEEVIDTITLTGDTGNPCNMSITPDGSRALVVKTAQGIVEVIDLNLNQSINSFALAVDPFDIEINNAGTKAYVTHLRQIGVSNKISVIDLSDYSVKEIPTKFPSLDIALSPKGDIAYLGDDYGYRIHVLDLISEQVRPEAYVGGESVYQIAFTPDGSKAFATDANNAYVLLISQNSLPQSRIYDVSGTSYEIQISKDDKFVFAPNGEESSISVIDIAENGISKIDVGGVTVGSALSPDGTKLYLVLPTRDLIAVLDVATQQLVETISLGVNADAAFGLVISPDGSKAYVASAKESSVAVIDLESHEISQIPGIANPLDLAITPDGTKLFATNNWETSIITIIDLVEETVTGQITLPNATLFLTVSPDGTKLYAPIFEGQEIDVFDIASGTLIDTISTYIVPTAMAISADGKRGFVTHYWGRYSGVIEGNVSIIDLESKETLFSVGTTSGVVGVVLNSTETELFVGSEGGFVTRVYLTNATLHTEPKGGISGELLPNQPVIHIVDLADGTLETFSGAVTASIASGSGSLSGITTVKAVNGVATFNNLRIFGSGEFTLKFTPDGAASITSNKFLVVEPPIQNYRVRYLANGFEVSDLALDANPLISGSKFELSTKTPSRTGHTFLSWNTTENGSGTSYLPGASVTSGASELLLYAQWKPNSYTLTLDANTKELTGALESVVGNYVTTVKIPTIVESKLAAGYQLIGWNTMKDGTGKSYPVDGTFQFGPSDTTLYAQWKINSYKISYDGNGQFTGRVPQSSINEFSSKLTIPAPLRSLTKRGYSFQGWNTAKDGSGTTYKVGDNMTQGPANLTLYALWKPNTYKVNYRNLTSAPVPSGEFTTGGVITNPPTPSARAGYVFKGWSASADRSKTVTFPYTPAVMRNISLYAVWEKVG